MCAMQAIRYMDRYGATEEHFALSAARMRTEGARNELAHLRTPMTVDAVMSTPYLAYPTRLAMACPRTISVSAMVRVAEAAQQVRRRCGAHQVDGVHTALGAGAGGSVQFFTVGIFSADPDE